MYPLIIYHGNCYDGFTAAWVARKHFGDGKVELFPGKYGEDPPDCTNREVTIVDFSYPRSVMLAMRKQAASLVVLDHHKTAQEDCDGLSFCEFDMNRSGARMTWDFFFPSEPVPSWILRVEDRDLWRFQYEDTKDFYAYMASLPMTMGAWDAIDSVRLPFHVEKGRAIRLYIENYCEKAAQEARVIELRGEAVVIVNVPYQNASEMAHVLLDKHPDCRYSMGWFQRADGKIQFSLRSRGDFDVSALAKDFGGGGHAAAAGFHLPFLEAAAIIGGK